MWTKNKVPDYYMNPTGVTHFTMDEDNFGFRSVIIVFVSQAVRVKGHFTLIDEGGGAELVFARCPIYSIY